jgi:glycosyltransferase involved in cell wall biosynthesis
MVSVPPSVACLMVTRRRLAETVHSVASYVAQDYPAKSLVVVADGESEGAELAQYIREHDVPHARVVAVPGGSRSLGALRNLAVDTAQSDYVCQWDDDDIYHSCRLSVQLAFLRQAPMAAACFMADQLHFFTSSRSVYWCDWSRPRASDGWPRAIPNTLLCERVRMPRYPEEGPMSSRSEDLYVMNELISHRAAVRLRGRAPMYVYVAHGTNTWEPLHHRRIAHLTGLGTADLLRRHLVLSATVPSLLPSGTVVRSYDGAAVLVLDGRGQLVSVARVGT